jgi:large subunit ribosomal protein L9
MVEVLLQADIINLGDIGQKVAVRPGFARNYLIPMGLASPANAENLIAFEKNRHEYEEKAKIELEDAQKRAKPLEKLKLKILARVSNENKLFGSISPKDIMNELQNKGCDVKKQQIFLSETPIRYLGKYTAQIQLHRKVQVTVPFSIVASNLQEKTQSEDPHQEDDFDV